MELKHLFHKQVFLHEEQTEQISLSNVQSKKDKNICLSIKIVRQY